MRGADFQRDGVLPQRLDHGLEHVAAVTGA